MDELTILVTNTDTCIVSYWYRQCRYNACIGTATNTCIGGGTNTCIFPIHVLVSVPIEREEESDSNDPPEKRFLHIISSEVGGSRAVPESRRSRLSSSVSSVC